MVPILILFWFSLSNIAVANTKCQDLVLTANQRTAISTHADSTEGAKAALITFFKDDPIKSIEKNWKRLTKRKDGGIVIRKFRATDGTEVDVLFDAKTDADQALADSYTPAAEAESIRIPERQEIVQREKLNVADQKIKVAFFDLDDTLRTSTKGNPSSNTKEEIKILDGRAARLRDLSNEGYLIAIVSNQGGIPKRYSIQDATDLFKHTIALIGEQGGVVNYFDFAEEYDNNRKPNPGMYQRLEKQIQSQLGSVISIDKERSFMVGDGAYSKDDTRPDGTPGTDFSNSDRLFAVNIGLRFFEASSYFLTSLTGMLARQSKLIPTRDSVQPGALLEVREITKNILGEPGDTLEIQLSPNATDIGAILSKATSNHFASLVIYLKY